MKDIAFDYFTQKLPYVCGTSDFRQMVGRVVETGYNLLLIGLSGSATVELFGKLHNFKRGYILNAYWEMQLKITSISDDFKVAYVLLSEGFSTEVYSHMSAAFCDLSYENHIWSASKYTQPMLMDWVNQIMWTNAMILEPQRLRMVKNLLENLFLACESEFRKYYSNRPKAEISREWQITREFGHLLFENIKAEHKVSFYADKLAITPYYLGVITRKTMGASPKTIIDREIIRQLKILLQTTDKTLSEIALEVNFEDTSYMCKFFTRHTGITMMEYRKEY